MNRPTTHVPIRPRFPKKTFESNIFNKTMPSRTNDAEGINKNEFQQFGGEPSWNNFCDEYDDAKEDELNQEHSRIKNPYDWVIMFMAIIIIVLILVVVWLVLSNNDDPVPDKVVSPQYLRQFPNQYSGSQQQNQQQYKSQYGPQQYDPQQFAQQNPQQFVQQNSQQSHTTRQDLDNVMNTLRKKNMKNEKLPIDELTENNNAQASSFQDICDEDKTPTIENDYDEN